MVKKTLGYVQTEWTCPNCQTRNPGPQKTCTSCGMPQPDDLQFEQAAQEKLITDEAEIARAKAGSDIHCHYCGTRNPASAATCSQCGADLSEGTARTSGQVLGAHRKGPAPKIICEACGTENEASASKCIQCGAALTKPEPEAKPEATPVSKKRFGLLGIGGGVVLLLLCAAVITFIVLFFRTEDINGTVRDVSWTRTIGIEALMPVERDDWRDEIPSSAIVGTCEQKVHHTQDTPTDNSKEVCGTPYSVDKGSGYAEVVQDCQYEVYAEWCEYTVDEWQEVDKVTRDGNDFSPQWPVVPALNRDQREGKREESYEIVFNAEQKQYTYTTSSEAEFNKHRIGTRWILKVNTFGIVIDTEPIQ